MLQADTDLSWYAPVDTESEVLGHYVGDHEALNIANPQPGFRYYYQRYTKGRSDAVLRFLNKGWSVVGPDDPEKFGTDRVSWKVQTPLGTERAYGDLILMKIPLDLYHKQQLERQERIADLTNDFGHRFVELGEERVRLQNTKPTEQLYYLGRNHGQIVEEI